MNTYSESTLIQILLKYPKLIALLPSDQGFSLSTLIARSRGSAAEAEHHSGHFAHDGL
jgi:hypothetical protein